jgi:hypothetical protein
MAKLNANDVNDFWNFVDQVRWSHTDDPFTVKRRLMKEFSPTQVKNFLPICKDLSRKLVEKYVQKGNKLSYFGAANIVGAGKDVYQQYITKQGGIDEFNEIVEKGGYNCCFFSVIPSEDDYFVLMEFQSNDELDYEE